MVSTENDFDFDFDEENKKWFLKLELRRSGSGIQINSSDEVFDQKFFNMGLFFDLFHLYWNIVSLKLIIFIMINDDRKQESIRKRMHHSITSY